ncbi:HAD family phosphatase [Frigoribacterium sp. UYMn621]|uniref:HAD family hydrolase n=1 Tax=Frigoribacterium sp. UYMn621 TaxID=3156343 RepID=UPI0033962038
MTDTARALSIPNRVVVFDYGEVISRSPSEASRAALEALAGVDPQRFRVAYEAHRDGLDRGTTSIRDYWMLVAADTGADWSEARIHELWVADFTGWISVDPAVFDVIAELHAGGTRIALLSNAGFDFASPFRYSPIARFFERMFVSAEMLKLKPEADIYLEVARELGISCAEMVFIDNKQVNVDGAVSLGITGHHFVGAAELRRFLQTISDR